MNGVTAQQKMRWEMIAVSQTKDELSHLGRIAILVAPERRQRLDHRAHGRFIIREQVRRVLVRASAPVRPHSAGFERAHLDAKRGHFLGQGLGESANRPFGGMVSRAAGKGQAAADGRDLKDAAALLLSHDRQRGTGHVDDAIEVGVHHRLESLRAQLLERRDIAVARVIHDDIETPERVHRHLHGRIGRLLIRHVEGSGANLIAVLLHQIFEAARVAGRRDEAIARCEHSFSDVAAQAACAAGYQPDF